MLNRNGHARAWMPWTIAAALPLGCAAVLLFWRRERRRLQQLSDEYDEWWRRRERVRAGDGASALPSASDAGRTNGLFV